MSFIDWADDEELLSLLLEYVAEERGDSGSRPTRLNDLTRLLQQLEALQDLGLPPSESSQKLRALAGSAHGLEGDPVLVHVEECAEELERVAGQSPQIRRRP